MGNATFASLAWDASGSYGTLVGMLSYVAPPPALSFGFPIFSNSTLTIDTNLLQIVMFGVYKITLSPGESISIMQI